ncbi:hypothetical protein E4U34_004462 [Claviceps purpurea]|nr:hypothetical protein E4U51_006810 [Claviceps purpurea]KAG6217681.1 hypothetical protein E4U34_004462 [Claviceps purpurea]
MYPWQCDGLMLSKLVIHLGKSALLHKHLIDQSQHPGEDLSSLCQVAVAKLSGPPAIQGYQGSGLHTHGPVSLAIRGRVERSRPIGRPTTPPLCLARVDSSPCCDATPGVSLDSHPGLCSAK